VRVAIVGTGISGLCAARRLNARADITVFESGEHPGGHSNTVEVVMDGRKLAIDTGFIVFNERTYPQFTALLEELGVAYQPAEMSFALACRQSGLEYCGRSLNALFAQRRNLLRPAFYRMLAGILRLNRHAEALCDAPAEQTLGDFLRERGFSGEVVNDYLLPMAGAIWSANPDGILEFPARSFGRFFRNHGLLTVSDQPQWQTVCGGSREYVKTLVKPFRDRLLLRTPVEWVERFPDHVAVKARGRAPQAFDCLVMACHSDEALALLRDPSTAEREVLGAIRYQANETVLHTDESLLPRRRRAWASWNYDRGPDGNGGRVSVTYNLTTLQRLPTRRQFLVTLNNSDAIAPDRVIQRLSYAHPVFDRAAFRAQARYAEINGQRRTYFCGAYWGYGFHEDGVRSAIAACEALETRIGGEDAELYLSGTG